VVQNVLSDSVEPSQLDQIFGFGWGFTYIAGVTLVSMVPAFFIVEPRKG